MSYRSALMLSTFTALGLCAAQAQPHPNSSESYAEPTQLDNLRTAASNLNAQRGQLFARRDAKGIAALYTQNATYVELLPYLFTMTGRNQIADHMQELFDANVNELQPTVTEAHMIDRETQMVTGDYALTLRNNRRIMGHFVQTLRLEDGRWKILSHVFARPEPITTQEMSYR